MLSYDLRCLEGKGPQHFGLCSAWLNTIEEGHMVPCCVHRYLSFHILKMLLREKCSPMSSLIIIN